MKGTSLCCDKQLMNSSLLPEIHDHINLGEAKVFQAENVLYLCPSMLLFSMSLPTSSEKGDRAVLHILDLCGSTIIFVHILNSFASNSPHYLPCYWWSSSELKISIQLNFAFEFL